MSIAHYMVDQIAVGAFQGDDNLDSVQTFAAPVVIMSRVEDEKKTIRKPDGTTIDFNHWISTMGVVGERDRVWVAPVSASGPRMFPPGFVFRDGDARTPSEYWNGGKQRGGDRHTEFRL